MLRVKDIPLPGRALEKCSAFSRGLPLIFVQFEIVFVLSSLGIFCFFYFLVNRFRLEVMYPSSRASICICIWFFGFQFSDFGFGS